MTLKQIRKLVIVLILVLISGFGGYYIGQNNIKISSFSTTPKISIERRVPAGKEDVDFALFWQVWDRLEAGYLDKSAVDYSKMVNGAISGMVAALGDPYTVYLPPSEQKQSEEDLAGSFEGVGIQLGYKDSYLAVIAPLKETPADKAGVKAGDLIVKIKDANKGIDKDSKDLSLPEAVSLIRGPKGSTVTLALLREGQTEPFEVNLVRDTILVKSVELEIKDGVAHLSLFKFGERTNDEWNEKVAEILKNKNEIKGVVLDLRNNPGGFLQGAVFVGSEFLKDGVIVKQESEGGAKLETHTVNRQGQLLDIPLVVLVNQGSASASEIVAGALQERGRAKIVGEKSFGKGTVQEAQELENGGGLHVTVARWLLPSGKSIHKEGITPDVEIKMDEKNPDKDPQLEKAIEMLQK